MLDISVHPRKNNQMRPYKKGTCAGGVHSIDTLDRQTAEKDRLPGFLPIYKKAAWQARIRQNPAHKKESSRSAKCTIHVPIYGF